MPSRTFLFLQGPASPFLRFLAEAIERKGLSVEKINLCLGDRLFWRPRRALFFRGRKDQWPTYLKDAIRDHNVTDIVMLGDGRAFHAAAAEIGIAAGLRVHILEHGYLRPDWLTIEPDGMTAHSRFPQDPERILTLAETAPSIAEQHRYPSSFLTYALYDLAFHLPNVALGWFLHPHYRSHGPVHPLVEYGGWVWKGLTRSRRRRQAGRAIEAWLAPAGAEAPGRFLFPLQLPGDYQIRLHAPGGDLFRLVEAVIASFGAHAPPTSRLLFKVHPIDNGLSRWPVRIAEAARRHGASGRVFVADGGDTDALITQADGVVTANSTVGLTALGAAKPVVALGAAIYDVPGLTFQARLAEFWQAPAAPDAALFDAFIRALAATTQVRGGFIGKEAIEAGAENVARRLLEAQERLPLDWRKPRGRKHFRYEAELFGTA